MLYTQLILKLFFCTIPSFLLNLVPAAARVPERPDVFEVDGGNGDLDLLEGKLLRLGEDVAVEGDEGGPVEIHPLAVAAPGKKVRLHL